MNNRIQTIVKGLLVLIVAVFALYEATKWTVMRVYVPPGKALMVINKFGDQLPPVCNRRVRVIEQPRIREGVRRDVDDPHDERIHAGSMSGMPSRRRRSAGISPGAGAAPDE